MKCSTNTTGKKSRYFTIMIIPSKSGSSKSIKIPKLLVSAFIVILAVFIYSIGSLAYKYDNLKKKHFNSIDNMDSLNSTIYSQQLQIDNYKKIEKEMKNTLQELKDIEDKLKTKYGISSSQAGTYNAALLKSGSLQLSMDLFKKNIASMNLTMNRVDKKIAAYNSYPSILPCYGKISSYYGIRRNPFSRGKYEFHDGIDIIGRYGSKIRAAADGTVTYAGWQSGYGYTVIISHWNGYITIYGHNSKILVKRGQRVSKGQTISLMGSTGRSTGTHVHFEIRYKGKPVNPIKVIKGGKI